MAASPANGETMRRTPRLYHVRSSELTSGTAQTSGMRREEAISGTSVGSANLWTGRTIVGPAVSSGDHHHGESETSIYVVAGHPEFVFLDDGTERRLRTEPGDFVYVPPWVPHREENPDPDEEAVVVISRTTQEAIVVNLPGLWLPEPSHGSAEGDAVWHHP
jgi:uncharacterized RmlC-like cupin family protein